MKNKTLLLKEFFHEHIVMRKAMFLPLAFITTFMLVGYAAIDKEAPVITTGVIDLPFGEEFDINALDITDNHDDFEDLMVVVDTLNLNINQLGKYTVSVVARDKFDNETTKNIIVNVVDLTAPEFVVLGTNGGYVVQVPVKGSTDVTKYINAVDNVDGDVTPFIEVSDELVTSKVGTQVISISVSDSSGNVTTKDFMFSIADNEAPIIRLLNGSNVTWNYGDDFNLSKIASIVDNTDDVFNVDIIGTVDVKKLNVKQTIEIVAVDLAGNMSREKVNITVKDIGAPVIKLSSSSVRVEMGGTVNVGSYLVSATDNLDGNLTSKVSYGSVSTTSAGIKTVTFTVTDSAGNTGKATLSVTVYNPNASSYGESALIFAKSKIGSKYVWGATGPNTFDCSGLMQWAFAQAGRSIPRTSSAQAQSGTYVAKADLLPGDIVFFSNGGSSVSHCGIYAGNGMMVHAGTSKGVVLASISGIGMTYVTARRYY